MAETLTDFLKSCGGEPQFKSEPRYNRAGDCVEYFFSNEAHHADRVDGVLTLYRADDNHSIIGFQVKGITALHKLLGNFGIAVNTGKVTVGMLILGAYYSAGDSRHTADNRRRLYESLNERLDPDACRQPVLVDQN